MVKLEVEVSKDLVELSFYELEALVELINGTIELLEYKDELIVEYRGDLEKLRNILCRAALIKQVSVIHNANEKETLMKHCKSEGNASMPRKNMRGGSIEIKIARTLVNLARTKRNIVFLDPFVGSGIIAYEAVVVGAHVLGIDISKDLLLNNNRDYLDLVNADSTLIPLRSESVDSIATDPPYGRLSIVDFDINALYRSFARESYRVLKKGGFLVSSHPTYMNALDWFLNEGFELVGKGIQFVHGSLTRLILILRKPN